MVSQIFYQEDVNAIARIPLLNTSHEDMRIWEYTPNGVYAVRSAYKTIMKEAIVNGNVKVPGDWKQIWNAKIPPRVKNLLWRICRGCIL